LKSNFSSLDVWKISFDYAINIYNFASKLPAEEKYALVSQLKRSASSIPANIAEGRGRNGDKEFKRFLYIARGSLEENKSHLLLAKELDYINNNDFLKIKNQAEEVGKVLNGMLRAINRKTRDY
jgi:four helix bundle protein